MARRLLFVTLCFILPGQIFAQGQLGAPPSPTTQHGALIQFAPGPAPNAPVSSFNGPTAPYPTTSQTTETRSHSQGPVATYSVPTGRKKWEALLQTPSRLQFGDRKTASVQEILDQLHRQHNLSIRLDLPTMSALFGLNSMATLENPNGTQSPQPPELPPPSPPPSTTPQAQTPAGPQTTAQPQTPIQPPTAVQAASATPVAPPTTNPGPTSATSNPPNPNCLISMLMKTEVNIEHVDMQNVSIANALRHALDAMPTADVTAGVGGLPIRFSNAWTIDYLVEDDGLLITTRMNAIAVKETRVYSVRHLKDTKAEDVANVIRLSVRPWSWRSHINDLGNQLKAGLPSQCPPELTALMTSGAQLAAGITGIGVSTCPPCEINNGVPAPTLPAQPSPVYAPTSNPHVTSTADAAAVSLTALVNGLVTMAQASLSAMEMIHFSDPPTGTIQTLPGKLIITQSQIAHREIANLLNQLGSE